jgi:hypothetical protein
VGVINAAIWCGSAIFMVIGLPALFSPDLKRLLTAPGVGFAAEAMVSRFFIVQYWCGGIALAHLLADWFFNGRPLRSLNLGLIIVVLSLGLAGGLWAQPKMRVLHFAKYFGKTSEMQAQAAKSFAVYHSASETANLVVIAGLVWYLWRVSRAQDPQRFVSFSKIRG